MPGGSISASAAARRHLDLDLLVVELALAQLLRNFWRASPFVSSRPGCARRRQQGVEHALLGASSALGRTLAQASRHGDGDLDQVAHDLLDVAADVADLGELGRLDLDEGRVGQRARRRAISVLPTPVGPIIRMFFGVISSRSGSSTCWRRQRLRSAMATARLASCWPTMWRSSSETISGGVICSSPLGCRRLRVQHLDRVVLVGVDADVAGDLQRLA
jgi:hypothetical protein